LRATPTSGPQRYFRVRNWPPRFNFSDGKQANGEPVFIRLRVLSRSLVHTVDHGWIVYISRDLGIPKVRIHDLAFANNFFIAELAFGRISIVYDQKSA